MPVNREPNTQKNYTIWNGGFGGGLFNSINGSLIPDNCLADISNLHIDHFGVLHSVAKPWQYTVAYVAGLSGPMKAVISNSAGVWCNRDGTLYDCGNLPTTYIAETTTGQTAESPADPGTIYWVAGNGLQNPTGTVAYATQDLSVSFPTFGPIIEFEGRIWMSDGNILRGSDLTDPALEETWRGPVDPVDLTTMTLANALIFHKMSQSIRYLFKCNGALYVVTYDGIYQMSSFFDGTMRRVYSGGLMPFWAGDAMPHIYSNGSQYSYVAGTKLVIASGGLPQVISDKLSLPTAIQWFVTEWDNRLWFLLCTEAASAGAVPNYLYAVDKDTGAWEKFDIQMSAVNGGVYDTPTCMMGSEEYAGSQFGDTLWLGTTLGKLYYFGFSSPNPVHLPWSFTTKTYTPSFDAYSRFVHFKIRYVGQALTSPVTITQHVCRDGVDSTSDVILTRASATLDMVGSGGGMFQKDIECKAAQGEGVYFTVSGTGTCEIADVGCEFSTRGSGDVNA
jgi:hypothetical protein